jgi:hypothetical protein
MTNAELYEKYPQPGQLLKQLQKRGNLPADLAAATEVLKEKGLDATSINDIAVRAISDYVADQGRQDAVGTLLEEARGRYRVALDKLADT